jgi:Fe-S-cluster containining protein
MYDRRMHDLWSEDEVAYGTARPDAPVSRVEFERAVRSLNLSDLDLRDTVLQLAARVVALTDEMTRRLDGTEPLPAPPGTPAPPPDTTVEVAVDRATEPALALIRANDTRGPGRVSLDSGGSKHETASPPVPCAELIPLCQARCCTMTFALSTEDLDEGVVRWDYGQPYLIRQRASDGYCVHHDPDHQTCTVHGFRPRVCRSYDCRNDPRVWIDYERRIATPFVGHTAAALREQPPTLFDLVERARARSGTVNREIVALGHSFADREPAKGPRPG